jgi:CheY-like chemotaxis protein
MRCSDDALTLIRFQAALSVIQCRAIARCLGGPGAAAHGTAIAPGEQYVIRYRGRAGRACGAARQGMTTGRLPSVPAGAPMDSPVTMLLIDDAAAMRTALARTLTRPGYRVCTAATVPEAEALLCCLGAAAIHLVIADIHLTSDPLACEGYALYGRWRAAHPALPFLLISGDPSSRALPAIQRGAVRFLLKPFGLQELLRQVHEILSGEHEEQSQTCDAAASSTGGRMSRGCLEQRSADDDVNPPDE